MDVCVLFKLDVLCMVYLKEHVVLHSFDVVQIILNVLCGRLLI